MQSPVQSVSVATDARMPVEKLVLGMFVSELDRPWSDTPFLLHGLLLETEAELDTICRLCREVTVDLSRSVGLEDVAPAQETAGASVDRWQAAAAWGDLAVEAEDRQFDAVKTGKAASGAVPGPAPGAAQGTLPEADPQQSWVPARRTGLQWSIDVLRELLESYLRPPPPPAPAVTIPASWQATTPSTGRQALQDLPSAATGTMPPRSEAATETGTWASIRRMFSGLLPRRRIDHSESPPATGTWASIRRMFSELLSRRRIDPAVAAPATGGPVALQAAIAKPEAEAAGYNTRIGPRLRVLRALCWRALRKLIGLERADPDSAPAIVAPTPDPRMDGAPPADDLAAEERAEAMLHVKGFDAELPRAARTIRQSLPVLLAAYSSAENDRPLEIETLDPVVTEIVDAVLRNQDAMLWLTRLQAHDQAAHARGLQAAVYMAQFGSHLGLPRADLERLALGGALLDIGKMQVPKEILRKPGPLDADERRLARSHVELGMRLLDASGVVDSQVREIVGRHHEREDGSGYPGQMLGDAIGLYGRIAGIVDTFLAMSEARPHAPALPMDYCLRVLLRAGGTLFHAPMVEHFIQMTGLYPVGSLVELSTGEVAAVLSHNRVRRLRPRVLVMVGADGEPLPRPMALDLLQQPHDAVGKEIRIVRGLPPGSHGIKAEDMFAATVPA